MKIAIYCRVSSIEQLKGNSINTQIAKGIEVCEYYDRKYQTYKDEGISGTNRIKDLPALNQLVKDIKDKKIIGIAITKLDRLTRNERNWLEIKELINEYKLEFYVDGKKVEYGDYDVQLILDIQQNLATHEVKRTRHRINVGLLAGIKRGRISGGKVQPYGYKEGENKMLVIDDDEAEVIREIFDLSIKGIGTGAISTILNDKGTPTKLQRHNKTHLLRGELRKEFIWKDGTIYRILTNPLYYGKRRFRGELYDAPNIISELTFNTVQKGFKTRKYFKDTTNLYFYLLKGLMICTKCKSLVGGYTNKNRGMNGYRCQSKRGHHLQNCGTRAFNIKKLDDFVLSSLNNLPDILSRSFKEWKSIGGVHIDKRDIGRSEERIYQYENKRDEVFEMDIKKEVKEKKINEYTDLIEREKEKISQLKVSMTYYDDEERFIKNVKKLIKPLSNKKITNEDKRLIVRSLIDKIEVGYKEDKRQISIYYKIDPSVNLTIGTVTEMDSLKYTQFDSVVQVVNTNSKEQPHIFRIDKLK